MVAAALALVLSATAANARELRVCADPNNLPFSNERLEGFENRIVAILADELKAQVSYTWWAQRRGFVRNTLNAELCDLVPGVLSGMGPLRTTRPYYRSTYVFVTRADAPAPASLDDPLLRELKVGVQLVGNDGSNTPPAHALARRGIVENVRGYTLYGDYREPNPPERIVRAVAAGEIDVALVWGPLAGYFAGREGTPLRLTPVLPQADGPRLPMVFDIAMGVRRGDDVFRREIEAALVDRRSDIDAVLAAYGVPRLIDDKWIYGSAIENIVATIREGRPNGMPSFRDNIPDDQIWEIAAYVRSMAGQVASDAAPGRNDDMNPRPAENRLPKTEPKSAEHPD